MDDSSTYITGSNDQERISRSKLELQKNMSGLESDDISTLTLLTDNTSNHTTKSLPLFTFPKGHELTHLKVVTIAFQLEARNNY